MVRPSPFAEDDKQWPGEDVTSTNRHTSLHQKFVEKVENVRIQNGRPSRSLKSKKRSTHNEKDNPPPRPRTEERTSTRYEETRRSRKLCHLPRKLYFILEMAFDPDVPYQKKMKKTAKSVQKRWKSLI